MAKGKGNGKLVGPMNTGGPMGKANTPTGKMPADPLGYFKK